MSKLTRLALPTVAAGLLLAGCSGTSSPPPAPPNPQAAASTHVKTPWDGMLKDEAKAKHVQTIVNNYAKKQRQAIDPKTH